MKRCKSQIATEFIILITALMLIFLPIFLIVTSQGIKTSKEFTSTRINDIGNNIVFQSRDIYFSGKFNKEIITVNMPEGIKEMGTMIILNLTSSVNEHYLIFRYHDGDNDIIIPFQSEVPMITNVTGYFNEGSCSPTNKIACNCPVDVSGVVKCQYYPFTESDFAQGMKNFQLKTVTNESEPEGLKIKVNITRVDEI